MDCFRRLLRGFYSVADAVRGVGSDNLSIYEQHNRCDPGKRDLRDHTRAFRFVHLSLPDSVGHDRGFMSRAYLASVERVDGLVGVLLAAVRSDPALAASTAVILTSDHGGKGATHADATRLANYRVLFVASGPGIPPGTDLYDLNPDYAEPGRLRTSYDDPQPPVRNGDLANLALDLLDLPAVPGSEHNSAQDLDAAVSVERD